MQLCFVFGFPELAWNVCAQSTQFMQLMAVCVNKVKGGKLSAGLVLDTSLGGQRCHEAKYGSTLALYLLPYSHHII